MNPPHTDRDRLSNPPAVQDNIHNSAGCQFVIELLNHLPAAAEIHNIIIRPVFQFVQPLDRPQGNSSRPC